jgi:hypothetical protein
MIKVWLVIAGIACGVVLASLVPGLIGSLRPQVGGLPGMGWLMGETTQASAARDASSPVKSHRAAIASPVSR